MKKKIFSLLLCGGLLISLTGCKDKAEDKKVVDEANKPSSSESINENTNSNTGRKIITCKAKSNDFANVVENMKSATRIEKYVVEENKVTDFTVNVEVVLDDKEYSKEEVNELAETLNYYDYTTSKKSDYVLNFKHEKPTRWFDDLEDENIVERIITSAEYLDYTCTTN